MTSNDQKSDNSRKKSRAAVEGSEDTQEVDAFIDRAHGVLLKPLNFWS